MLQKGSRLTAALGEGEGEYIRLQAGDILSRAVSDLFKTRQGRRNQVHAHSTTV